MAENTQHLISFYTKGKLSKPSKSVDRFDIYESIKTNYLEETEYIQSKYGNDIANGFISGKSEYQKDKKSLLNAACFSGDIDRSQKHISRNSLTGIINLDIDENTKSELEHFFCRVSEITFCEAAARSVSHNQTGAFWLNARIEIPANWSFISIKLRNLLGLKRSGKSELSFKEIEIIHKAYHEALTYIFAKESIKVGKAKDVKRIRYLTNDPNIYINPNAQVYNLRALELILLEISKKDEAKTFNRIGANINKSDAFEFATEFAFKSTGNYGQGNKHNYLVHFAIACNRLGVEQSKVEVYIENTYPDKKGGNYLSFPYQKYKQDFGAWKYKIYKKGIRAFKEFTLEKGQYLGDIWTSILDTYLDCWTNEVSNYWDWKAGTGTGKSTVVATLLAPALKEFTGIRTVIVYPLNSLCEKQAIKYGMKYLTGEVLDPVEQQEALSQDIIFCNQNTFPRLVEHFAPTGEQFHLFFDESHDLPNGTNYKFDVVSELWHKKDKIAASITLLSGTPTDYFSELGFKRLNFIQIDRPKIKLICKEMVQAPDLTALNHCKNTNSINQILVQLQSKKSIDNITELLSADYDKTEVLKFYSEAHIKQEGYYQDLIRAGETENSFRDSRFIFCTSFINTGIDVYCNNKDLDSIYINKLYSHNLNDLLQFGDRWRTSKDKTVYYYYKGDKLPEKIKLLAKELDELDDKESEEAKAFIANLERLEALKAFQEKEYNPRYEFKKLLIEYRYRANYYNSRLKGFENDTLTDAYNNEISESNFFIIEEGEVFVNEMYLMKLVHQKAQKNITFKRFKQRIENDYPYVDIIDGSEEKEAPEALKLELSELKKLEGENKDKLQDKIFQFFVSPMLEVFLQAIRLKTDDSVFKRLVRPNKLLKNQALQLIADNQLLFDRYLCHAVTAYKRIKELEKLHLAFEEAISIVFKTKSSGLTVLATNRGYAAFVKKYKIQILLFLYTIELETGQTILSKFQRNDVKRYRLFINAISQKAQDGKIDAKSILFTALSVWNKRGARITTGITQNIAVSIFRSLFSAKYSNHLYCIEEFKPRLELESVFENHKISAFLVQKRIEESVQVLELEAL